MNNLTKTFENRSIQIVMNENQEPLFVVQDICDVLGLDNPTKVIQNLDKDEKLTSVIVRAGKKIKMNLVDESGLYTLTFKSRKPEAIKFRKWVTKEVLPSIRKTGKYETKVITAHERILNLIQNKEQELEMVNGEKLGLAKRERELRQEIKYLINSNPAQLQLFN